MMLSLWAAAQALKLRIQLPASLFDCACDARYPCLEQKSTQHGRLAHETICHQMSTSRFAALCFDSRQNVQGSLAFSASLNSEMAEAFPMPNNRWQPSAAIASQVYVLKP